MAEFAGGLSPRATGLKGRCLRCGEGHLFNGFLTLADPCDVCGLDFGFADSGDCPAVLIMLRPFKGVMVNLQYKTGARPGGGPGDWEGH